MPFIPFSELVNHTKECSGFVTWITVLGELEPKSINTLSQRNSG